MRRGLVVVVLAACHGDPPPPAAAPPPAANVPITATTGPAEGFGSGGHAEERKGTLPLTPPMQFALLGADGTFDDESEMVVFDLDRDGKLDTSSLDSDELYRNFEKHVTLDGKGYAFAAAHDGSALTLTPLATKPPPRVSLRTGAPAPDFTATTLEGGTVTLSQLRGKPVVLDFWSKTCLPCLRSLPIVEELPAKGVEVISLADADGGDPAELVRGHPGHHVVDYGTVETLYRIDRFPTYFLVDKTGTIACARCPFPKLQDALK
jgi:cytochrome c biogenesis protein CcmG/thiol:disulfide interchange protein DsbE